MKFSTGISALLSLAGSVFGQAGPYQAGYTTHSQLPRHTVYRPTSGSPGTLPVLIWGNGACSNDGRSVSGFLTAIASHGYLVISQGAPGGSGSSSVSQMQEAVTWVANGASGLYNINRNQIMTAGFSCGGTEAYSFYNDARVKTIGILNSGLLGNYGVAGQNRKPIIFLLGGPSDIAYGNGERDYAATANAATFKGNLNRVGHGGTYYEANGGLWATAVVNWMNWLFKGNTAGRTWLEGNNGFNSAVRKNFNLVSAPIGGSPSPSPPPSGNPPPSNPPPSNPPPSNPPPSSPPPSGCSALYGQCGGSGYSGPKCCSQGTCKFSNDWYSQCL